MALEETIGIMGGSFNPVHIGHLMLAQYLCQWKYVDKVWLTLSPQNPLKSADEMMPDMKRLAMLQRATKDVKGIETCDIELAMPRPSYTINTLDTLAHRYPLKKFRLVIGSDNWEVFRKWRDWERIVEEYGIIVYPRRGHPIDGTLMDGVEAVDAPIIDISSTFIRRAVAAGRDVSFFLPQGVYKYITDNNLYTKKER